MTESKSTSTRSRTTKAKAEEPEVTETQDTPTKTQAEQLKEPFNDIQLKSVSKGGAKLTYIPVAEVITRANEVLGPGNWGYELREMFRDPHDPDFVVAAVEVTATIDGATSSRVGVGGVKIKRQRSNNDIVDLGDEYKGAVSDALKKGLQAFGVGLYLARDEEAILSESSPGDDESPPWKEWTVATEDWEAFTDVVHTLNDQQKADLKAFAIGTGRWTEKPSPTNTDREGLELLVKKAVEIRNSNGDAA